MTAPARSLDPQDITGVFGILPTPSTPDADRWDCTHSIDVDATADMTQMVAAAGISDLITCGSFGEGASLLDHEHQLFTQTVCEALAGRGRLYAGVTTLNTRHTIALARSLVDRGAYGLFLGRPMWMSLDAASIVRFYTDVAEALPGVPILVYDNQFAFKAKIDTATYAALAQIKEVVATKHIGGPSLVDDLLATEGQMAVLPVDSQWAALARAHPSARACWTGNVADGPEPLVALAQAIKDGRFEEADDICQKMAFAQSAMFPGGKIENFVDYNVPIAHARLEGSGLVRSGPPRPPYTLAPEDYLEGGRETGRRWAALRKAYASKVPA
ncbi:MAG: dihydrodipicolinate synthase family protein [Pseudomonadota bacterium]